MWENNYGFGGIRCTVQYLVLLIEFVYSTKVWCDLYSPVLVLPVNILEYSSAYEKHDQLFVGAFFGR